MSEDSGHTFGSVSPATDIPIPKLPSLRPVQKHKFIRPGIEVRRDIKRIWQEIWVEDVEPGDTVAEVGQVAAVKRELTLTTLENVLGSEFKLSPNQKVLAFVIEAAE